jgi:FKBP-type peptidyl-prolyl cis-trans isomerase
MKIFSRGIIQRFCFLLLLPLTAGSLMTACKKNSEPAADYSAVDDATIKQYIATNNITPVQKQPSGLYFVPVTTNTTAAIPTAGQAVSVLYTGKLLDGTVFDASSKHGNEPLNFVLGQQQLIPGFEEGISLMHKGDKAVLLLPSALAYGTQGSGSAIPPNTVIRFDVELVDINFASIATTDDTVIQKYLTANNITAAQKQPSGLYYVPTLANSAGAPATSGKTAVVQYKGYLMDGTLFDSSQPTTPLSFVVGSGAVIPGFDQGIALMHKGEKATLLIPSTLGYGSKGASNVIPPYSVLRFEVELVDVQ